MGSMLSVTAAQLAPVMMPAVVMMTSLMRRRRMQALLGMHQARGMPAVTSQLAGVWAATPLIQVRTGERRRKGRREVSQMTHSWMMTTGATQHWVMQQVRMSHPVMVRHIGFSNAFRTCCMIVWVVSE
jgi:hypothetical protein